MAMTQSPKNSSLGTAFQTGSKTSASQHMPSERESGDLGGASPRVVRGRQKRKDDKSQPAGYASEESDSHVVPGKSENSRVTPEDSMEGRSEANGKPTDRNAHRAQDRERALTHVEWVGVKARRDKEERFNNLLNHIKVPLLEAAYGRLRKDAAAGVDRETW